MVVQSRELWIDRKQKTADAAGYPEEVGLETKKNREGLNKETSVAN
jgi:hypothetical protein